MHAPDKLAFLAGSDQAMPFPSPPSYPEKQMMSCQRGSVSQITQLFHCYALLIVG